MPLEHFGESWSHYGSRPLSESGLSSGATNGRASSDGRDRERGLETFHENSGKDDTEDSTFLSKLTGVSRSVSWGRSTLNQRKDATLLRTSSGSKVDSRMPGKPRPRSHQASASLNMSPSLSSPVTPEDTSAQTSSTASSAAFSLRSLSRSGDYEDTVSNHSRTTSRHSLRDLPLTDAYESSAMYNETTPPNAESNPIAQSHSRETNELSKLSQPYKRLPTPPQSSQEDERSDIPVTPGNENCQTKDDINCSDASWTATAAPSPRRALPPLPFVQEPDAFAAATSPDDDPRISNSLSYRSLSPSADTLGLSASSQSSAQDTENLLLGSNRRHVGSFQSRAQLSNPELALTERSDGGRSDSPALSDTRSGNRLIRLYSRLLSDQGSQSGSTTPGTLSPPPNPAFMSFSSLALDNTSRPGLQSTSALPRPPKSPLLKPHASSLEDDDDVDTIHGLTTRSATPISSPSPQPPSVGRPMGDAHTHSIDDYDVGPEIGRGAYGFVRRARSNVGHDDVVVKYIYKNCIFADSWRKHRVYGTIPSEIFVLLQLQHTPYEPPRTAPPYILNRTHWSATRDALIAAQARGEVTGHPGICKLVDFFEDEDYYYMVMPRFGDGQDLFDLVESSPYGLDPAMVRNTLGQLADVMAFMHLNGIVHRDIKDENVILDAHGMIQLIDFGSATRIRPTRPFDTFSGTMDYAAVEILKGEKYKGPPQDVWAFGVVAYVLMCGECPFENAQEAERGLAQETRPQQVLYHYCVEQPHHESTHEENSDDGGGRLPQLYDLIRQCLQVDPEARPTATRIMQHAFLEGASGWQGLFP